MIFTESTHLNHTVCRLWGYNMRKLILTSLFAAVSVSFFGCGAKAENSSETKLPTGASAAAEEEIELDTYAPLATVRDRDIVFAEDFDYEIYEGGVIITKYKGKDTAVELPSEVEGCPVKEIGFFAFEAREDIISVTLPESVVAVGEGAFIDCTSLIDIELPAGLTKIDRGAFAGCTSIAEITLPAALKTVQEGAFAGCNAMTVMTVLSNDLEYERWGLEELPNLAIYAPEGSAAAEWAGAMGKYVIL